MLTPLLNKIWQEFMKVWVCILAQPHLNHEALHQWDADHPNQPFTEVTGSTINIKHLSLDEPTFSATMVMNHAIHNHIPPSWINHGYLFGLHFLDHYSMTPSGPYLLDFGYLIIFRLLLI